MSLDRQYIGITDNATVIVDDDGEVVTMTGLEWKQYKADGNEVSAVGALPARIRGVRLVRDDGQVKSS